MPTAQEVQALLDHRRAAAQSLPPSMSRPEIDVGLTEAPCRLCGEPTTVSVVRREGGATASPPVTCQDCLDAQARAERPEGATTAEPSVIDWLHGLGVNTRKHGEASLDNFDDKHAPRALIAAREFVAETIAAGRHSRVRGLCLVDERKGTGKSHLAVAIMRAVHEARPTMRVLYDPADRLISRAQDTYGTGATDAFIEARRLAGLYVLDDLGREKGTEDALRVLCTVLDEREGAPTVITANALPAQLAERYRDASMWERVASRLGDGVYRYVGVPGVDRRFRAQGAA